MLRDWIILAGLSGYVKFLFTHAAMIRSFKSRALSEFWQDGNAARIRPDLVRRIRVRLARLDQAMRPTDMNLPGFDFHRLHGTPVRYTVHVSGPWCITFEWDGEDAVRVDLEQYH